MLSREELLKALQDTARAVVNIAERPNEQPVWDDVASVALCDSRGMILIYAKFDTPRQIYLGDTVKVEYKVEAPNVDDERV